MNQPGLSFNPLTGLSRTKKNTSLGPFALNSADANDSAHYPGYQYGSGSAANPSTGTVGGSFPLGSASAGGLGVPGYGGFGVDTGIPSPLSGVPVVQPDWSAILASDPYLTDAKAALASQHDIDRAGLAAARQRAIIGYGAVPDAAGANSVLTGDFAGDITPETADLATKATNAQLSTVGRLQQQRTLAESQLKRALAARGALQSGELPYQETQLQTGYTQAGYDALQTLIGALSGYNSNYVSAENSREAARQQAIQAAALRDAQQYAAEHPAPVVNNYYGPPASNPGPGNASATPTPPPVGPAPGLHGNPYAATAADIRYRISTPGGRGGV